MFVESRSLPDGTSIETDICVIGAGAAGIAIAHSLIGSGLRVAVLESGGFDGEPATQALAAGTLRGPGREPIDVSRLRQFGGSTNHWAGWCRPLDAVDFQARPGMPGSGWPIARATLDPFYARAMALCELGPDDWADIAGWMPDAPPFDPARLALRLFQVSPPTRFGETYRAALQAAANVTVHLHANATELLTDAEARRVERVSVRSLDGGSFSVTAREVVLATGGLENARLLLLSRRTRATGLGNGDDMVGRYFMDHPWVPLAGLVRFTAPVPPLLLGEQPLRGTSAFASLYPSPALLRLPRDPIGNFRAVFTPLARVSEGLDSLRALLGAAAGLTWPADAWAHLGRILADADLAADRMYRRLTGAATSPFTTPPRLGAPPRGAIIDLNLEQAPNPDSRVTLGHDRDALGQPRLVVDWRLGETERRTFAAALHLLGLEFGRLGLGRVNVAAAETWPPADLRGSRHHMGTTRMSTSPRSGVVDSDCRVHGMANLSIAGSSVFPTSGPANPTLTIVALALRLADSLRRRLG
jgi:choline dehydrogenase-like flavoprotein